MSSSPNLKSIKDDHIYQRNLPHWEIPGSAYFITFNTFQGCKLSDKAKDIVFTAIKYYQDKKYKLYACVVMTTHVHIILLPFEQSSGEYFSLAQIMHGIKSYSANRIQRIIGKTGRVWLDENYDRIIRSDSDFFEKMNYIMNNPVKAGLATNPDEYAWLFYRGLE